MSLVEELKKISNIENDEVKFVISELLISISEDQFTKNDIKTSIDMSKRYWNRPWNYHRFIDTKLAVENYWDKAKEVYRKKGEDGAKEFEKNIE